MASLVDRGNYWQVKWTFNGEAQQRRFVKEAEGAAKACTRYVTDVWHNRIADVDDRLEFQTYLIGGPAAEELADAVHTWKQVQGAWLDAKRCQPQTMSMIIGRLRNHASDWDTTPIKAIKSPQLNLKYRELVNVKGLAESTARVIMATFCEVINYANAMEWTPFNPSAARKAKLLAFDSPMTNEDSARDAMTPAERAAMLQAMPTYQARLILLVMLICGPRIGEVLALAVEDYDPKLGVLHFRNRMLGSRRAVGTKGSRGGVVKLGHAVTVDTTLRGILDAWVLDRVPTEPLFPRWVRDFWTTDAWRRGVFKPVVAELVEAGLCRPEVTPHWTRHTTGTANGSTLSDKLLQLHMRHANSKTTAGYVHPDKATVTAIRAGLDEAFADLHGHLKAA